MPRVQSDALPVYPTLTEVHAMLDACANERDRLLLKLLWYTGGRINEILRVHAGDVTERGIRMINEKQGKYVPDGAGGKKYQKRHAEKHVFVPDEFLDELKAMVATMRPTDLLVQRLDGSEPTRPLTREAAGLRVRAIATRAGVMKQRWSDGLTRAAWCHTFRHGHAINLLLQGVPITVVQRQLGHASLQNTQWYTQIADPHMEGLVNKVKW